MTSDIKAAADLIKRGGLAAFPTETVYGLGANAFDEAAVRKIFLAKGRPSDNPLIVHVALPAQIDEIVAELSEHAKIFIKEFFPGPLTIVARSSGKVARSATAGLDTVAFRMPSGPIAQSLITAAGVPLVAPSANLSGRPSPTTWQAVFEDMNGRIDCILKGEPTTIGLESTVVDCSGDIPLLLRTGSVSLDELRAVVPETVDGTKTTSAARSPGTRHRHYSPAARVVIYDEAASELEGNRRAFIGLARPQGHFEKVLIPGSPEQYAKELFEFFRECDRDDIDTIYCGTVSKEGIGAALIDRITRAAE